MASPATFTENNSPAEYAPWMGMTITRGEDVFRKKPVKLIGLSPQATSADVITANAPASLTVTYQFIVIQIIDTEVTSGLDVSFLRPCVISPLGETTETHVRYGYDHPLLRFGNLGYTEVQPWHQLVALPESPWISTEVIQEEERETIRADTDRALSFKDLVSALDRISRPTEMEDIPLPFDPDDYPVV